MAIEFLPVMTCTSHYPNYFSDELKQYDALNEGEYTFEYQNGFVASYISVNNPPYSPVVFTGVQTSQGFTFNNIQSDPGSWGTANLFTIVLGKNSDGVKVELIGTISTGNQMTTSGDWYLTISTRVSGPNQPTVTATVMNETGVGIGRIYEPSSAGAMLVTEYAFGLGLLKIPGRPDDVNQRCLALFYGGNCSDNNIDYVELSQFSTSVDGTRRYDIRPANNSNSHPAINTSSRALGCVVDLAKMAELYSVDVDVEIFSPEAGRPSGPGGMVNPSFDDSSDTIEMPDTPSTELVNMGFYHMYEMSLNSLNNLGHYVFGEEPDGLIAEILAIGKNLFRSRLVDYIISCHTIPVSPQTASGSGYTVVKLGGRNLNDEDYTVGGTPITSDYVDFDCGTISLDEYYANFADFLENCKLYLPFIGFVPARPEWFKRTSLTVKYRFNVIDGSCIAFVMSTGEYVNNNNQGATLVGQYSGTASIRYPVTGLSYANTATGVIGAVAGVATGAGAGTLAGLATSAVALSQARPDIVQSNGYNACSAMMGVRRPYLYIERPVASYAENYQHELGLPSNIYAMLGSVSGFAQMEHAHLDGIPCTDEERAMIAEALRHGVIV